MPPFQIPKNRSKKSQREQLSKVLAFVKYERNIRAAEGCTIMPIPTTNKQKDAISKVNKGDAIVAYGKIIGMVESNGMSVLDMELIKIA